VRRNLIAIILVLGLFFGSVAYSDLFSSGSLSVASVKEFRSSMHVAAGVDDNSTWISDGLELRFESNHHWTRQLLSF